MKRIVLCFDGTWDRPANPSVTGDQGRETNVRRFFESVTPVDGDGVAQQAWYNPGVGTDWYDHVLGGVSGFGLDEHILAGYRHLASAFEAGDEVYVVGFSRGAYAARSLVGLVRNCGLPHADAPGWASYVAYGLYRARDDGPDSRTAVAFRARYSREITVHFLGVWDTVGALGIPLPAANALNDRIYQFHDTRLSGIVTHAYQAIALDEHRGEYRATLWEPDAAPAGTLEQRWFVGAHADVGGGYADDRRLADLTLGWMQSRAGAVGLTLRPVADAPDRWRGTVHDSYRAFLGGLYARTRGPYERPVLATRYGGEVLDPTIDLRRRAEATYRPANPGLPPLA